MGTEKLKVINLFAGPGAGKSTTRAMLFGLMKLNGKNVEEVTEYAKDVTWEKNFTLYSDQLFVTANQNRRLDRLLNQVEWVVSDSPLLLSIHYATPDYLPKTFNNLIYELWDTYDNYNFFIKRNKPYVRIGRSQTEDEAREIDDKIIEMLDAKNMNYITIDGGMDAARSIYDHLFKEH